MGDCPFEGTPTGKWCLTDACYIRETQLIIMLNHVIDNYQLMVEEFND